MIAVIGAIALITSLVGAAVAATNGDQRLIIRATSIRSGPTRRPSPGSPTTPTT